MRWGIESLPGAGIRALAQTPDGYVWLGTNDGLVRFDGLRFNSYDARSTPNAGEGGITVLSVGPDGTLFYGTSSGDVGRVTNGRFELIPHDGQRGVVCSLFADENGGLWFALYGRGLRRWPGHGPASRVSGEAPVPLAFVRDTDGTLLFGTEHNGLCAVDGKVDRCIPNGGVATPSLPHFDGRPDAIQALHRGRDGALWMGTPNGLIRWQGGRLRRWGRKEGLSHEDVWAILEDSHRNIWIGTSGGGLNRLTSDGRLDAFTVAEGLLENDVRALLEDHHGNLWVGTAAGLNCLSNPRIVTYGRVEGLGGQIASSVAPGRDGSVWIGSTTGTLLRLRDETIETLPLPFSAGHRAVLSLREARDGSVWARANNRLFRVKDGVAREYFPPGRVSALAEDEHGLIFNVMKFGLARLRGDRFVPHELKLPELDNPYVHLIHPASDGTLWVASAELLLHLRPGGVRTYTRADGLPGNRVRWVSEATGGGLWLATDGGLAQLKDGRIRALTAAEGLPENYLRLVLDDGRKHLWIVTTASIVRVERSEVEEVLARRLPRIAPIRLDTTDGLDTTESGPTNDPGFRAADGRLWFATARGVAMVEPEQVNDDEPAPPIHIERVAIDGRVVDHQSDGVLVSRTGALQIDYRPAMLPTTSGIRVRYKMSGIDDWIDVKGRRSAYFTNLSSGDYEFVIQASNPVGIWNGPAVRLKFKSRPPFHRTWLFYGLIASAILVALVAGIAHRVRVEQMRATIDERTRLSHELHDTLAQSLAGAGIQLEAAMAALPDRPELASQLLGSAREMLRAPSDEVRRSIWVLRTQSAGDSAVPTLAASLRHVTDPAGLTLDVSVSGRARALPADVEGALLRIAHEAVTNAVRHAHARRLTVTVAFEGNAVELRMRDDGRGFDSAPWLTREREDRYGVVGMAERARRIGGTFSIESWPGAGTEIRCRLPLRSSWLEWLRGRLIRWQSPV